MVPKRSSWRDDDFVFSWRTCSAYVPPMRKGKRNRIWPAWTANVGTMIDASAIVRFACFECREIFDVDLIAIAHIRGRAFSLIDASARCKRSRCRGAGHFIGCRQPDERFQLLLNGPGFDLTPAWLAALRPVDVDKPGRDDPPPRPPAAIAAAG